jgi:hypothetical protein
MQPRIRKEFVERIKADALSMGVNESEMLHLILTWHYFPNPNQSPTLIPKTEASPEIQKQAPVDNSDDFDSLLDDL